MASRCCRVIVRGRVQGVGFRAGLAYEARRLGATGWVRNRLDGSVEALICADAATVEALLTWLAHGPPGARVDAVTTGDEDVAPASPPDRFEQRPTA